MFDVADPAAPRRLGTLDLAGLSAPVEADERAFTYLPARSLAVLPVTAPDAFGLPAAAVAVGVGVDHRGRPYAAGRFAQATAVLRVVALGGRLVALTESTAVLLDPQGLRRLASVRLTPLNTG